MANPSSTRESQRSDATPFESAATPASEILACVSYRDGQHATPVSIADLGTYLERSDSVLWVGLKSPAPDLLAQVARKLHLNDKAVDELIATHRRPKIIDFGNAVLIVAITVEIENQKPLFGETQIVIGTGFLLTVRRGASSSHTELRQRLEASPDLLARGSDFIAAELLDLLVDRYVAAAATLEHIVETAEQKLMIRGQKDADVRKVYRQRRDLLRIHTAISPMAEICRRVARVEMSGVDLQARPYFGEVADRVVRVDELFNNLREALAFAFEASLMIGQSQQNDTTRKLAAWAAILAVPTAIAGIYGMNFEFMPELHSRYGYPVTLGIILAACGVLYWRFKKTGWL